MAKLPGGLEKVHIPLYDSTTFAAAVIAAGTTITMFTSGIGVGGKTLFDTNMRMAGQLPHPQVFEVLGFSIMVDPGASVADAVEVLANASFRFTIDAKVMFEMSPLAKMGGGGGVSAGSQSAATAPVAPQNAINGHTSPRSIYALSESFIIESQQSFNAELVYPIVTSALVAATKIWVYIEGILGRAIQ